MVICKRISVSLHINDHNSAPSWSGRRHISVFTCIVNCTLYLNAPHRCGEYELNYFVSAAALGKSKFHIVISVIIIWFAWNSNIVICTLIKFDIIDGFYRFFFGIPAHKCGFCGFYLFIQSRCYTLCRLSVIVHDSHGNSTVRVINGHRSFIGKHYLWYVEVGFALCFYDNVLMLSKLWKREWNRRYIIGLGSIERSNCIILTQT